MSDVFTELKRLINRSQMPVPEIARRCQLSPVTIQLWLDGKTRAPRLENLLKVAALFDRRIELVNGAFSLAPDTPASVAAKLNQAREFVGYWRRWQ